jgi:hypothetical protein
LQLLAWKSESPSATIAAVTPAGSAPPAAGRAAADDAAGALVGAVAGAGVVEVDDVPLEQALSAAAAASNRTTEL